MNNNIIVLKNEKLENNTYIIDLKNILVVIDLSWNYVETLNILKKNNFKKVIFFYTHGHYDHIGEINNFIDLKIEIEIFISKKEKKYLFDNEAPWPFQNNLILFKDKIKYYEDNNEIILNKEIFKFIHTPGHSSGSYSIIYKNIIFTGDFLFAEYIGRFDFVSSSLKEMKESVNYFIKNIDDSYLIYPGHWELSSFKMIKKENKEFLEILNYEEK